MKTIKQKAIAYDEAIRKLRGMMPNWERLSYNGKTILQDLIHIFPELAESEDEKIGKWLLDFVQGLPDEGLDFKFYNLNKEQVVAWLENAKRQIEKQGEQNHSEQDLEMVVQPKFNIGDWIVSDLEDVNEDFRLCKIIGIEDGCYTIQSANGCKGYNFFEIWESDYHLWSIADAKPGDVLIDHCDDYKNPLIFILKKFERVDFGLAQKSDYSSYCFLTAGDKQRFKEGTYHHKHNIKPATKKQRDLLFQKMHEAGYTFDFEKKELKKLKFRVGDEVITENEKSLTITKIDEEGYWSNDLFICGFNTEHIWDLVEQKPIEWKQENREELTEFENAMMHIGGSFFGENAGLDPNDTDKIKEQAELLLELAPKTEWSEEDERNLRRAIRTTKVVYPVTADWLKFLKERVQPQNNIVTDKELAQAKKEAYNETLDKIEYHSGEPTFDDDWNAAIWYLKKRNGKPQNTWKPSNEQMHMLRRMITALPPGEVHNGLESLYNDLKKLTE